MAPIDPKLIVIAGFAFPIAYIWAGWKFPVIFVVMGVAYAWYTFHEEYMLKSEQKKFTPPPMGLPEQPFRPPTMDWDIGPDGEPVPKYRAPPPQYQQPYGGRR